MLITVLGVCVCVWGAHLNIFSTTKLSNNIKLTANNNIC